MGKENSVLERELSRELRKNWKGWISFIEPGLGSDFGLPDTEVFVAGNVVKIELKVAEIKASRYVDKTLLLSREIRPAQMNYHLTAVDAGLLCYFLFGVKTPEDWALFIGVVQDIGCWKTGMVIGRDVKSVGTTSSCHILKDWLADQIERRSHN